MPEVQEYSLMNWRAARKTAKELLLIGIGLIIFFSALIYNPIIICALLLIVGLSMMVYGLYLINVNEIESDRVMDKIFGRNHER